MGKGPDENSLKATSSFESPQTLDAPIVDNQRGDLEVHRDGRELRLRRHTAVADRVQRDLQHRDWTGSGAGVLLSPPASYKSLFV